MSDKTKKLSNKNISKVLFSTIDVSECSREDAVKRGDLLPSEGASAGARLCKQEAKEE